MFYEEARELLIGLEEGLMELERRQGDRAHLDKTFRAAHSLKGAGAMVGLRAIAEFTHGIEAVLDWIRSGSLAVDSDMITTLLEARDHLAAMVEAEAAQSPIPPSAELSQRLNTLLRGTNDTSRPSGGDAGRAAALPSPPRGTSSPEVARPGIPAGPPPVAPPPVSPGGAAHGESGHLSVTIDQPSGSPESATSPPGGARSRTRKSPKRAGAEP